ncbi:MAG: hypothetical protein AB7H43_04585 [Acidimicrobiia bacterium]
MNEEARATDDRAPEPDPAELARGRLESLLATIAGGSAAIWLLSVVVSVWSRWDDEYFGSSTSDRAQLVTLSLANAWGYLLVTTAAVLGIVLLRSRRMD